MSVPLWAWFVVLGVIVAMLAVDLVAHRKAHVIGVREAAAWSIVWVLSASRSASSSGTRGVRSSVSSTSPDT